MAHFAHPQPLRGKTAFITGAAHRIGAATALALARQGADVILHYLTSSQDAARTAEAIIAAGSRAWLIQADLNQPDEADLLLKRAVDLAGPVHILINNAGIFPADRITNVSVEQVLRSLQMNAFAPWLIARRFFEQGLPGHIVNFLDARIVDYDQQHASYHLAKRMLFTLTQMMALEFAPAVQVNAVAPGLILPPEGKDVQYLESLAFTTPLNRYGSVEGVTDAVAFLVTSDFITGQVIFVDGGRHLRGSTYGC